MVKTFKNWMKICSIQSNTPLGSHFLKHLCGPFYFFHLVVHIVDRNIVEFLHFFVSVLVPNNVDEQFHHQGEGVGAPLRTWAPTAVRGSPFRKPKGRVITFWPRNIFLRVLEPDFDFMW